MNQPKSLELIAKLKQINPKIIALVTYTIIAVFLTWPLVLHLTTHYPSTLSTDGGDPNMYIWFMDTVAHKVMDGSFHASQMVFYPDGMNFLAGYEAPIMLAFSTPIILIFHNPILAYNLTLLLAFILTAYACFSLILYLTSSKYAAVISGFSFGFSEYMMVRGTQHIDLLFLFVVPWVILQGFKFVDQPTKKNIFFVGLSLLVASLSAWYYLLGCLMFLGLLFLFKYKKFFENKKQYVVLALVIVFAVGIPALPMFIYRTSTNFRYVNAMVADRGADPLNFFIPHPYVFMKSQQIYQYLVSPYESTSYYGLIGLVVLVAMIFFWKKIKFPNKGLWVVSTIFFMLVAIGKYWDAAGHHIPMPFAILEKITPFDRLRAPNRFFVFSYLSVTVVFAYVLIYVKNLFQNYRLRVFITILILCLLLAERLIIPYPIYKVNIPQFYKDLGQNHENFAIADIPLIDPGLSLYNYYQITHKKPIVDGEYFWTAYNSHTFDFIKHNQLMVNSVLCDLQPPEDISRDQALKQLAAANVRYLVIHNFIIHYNDCWSMVSFLHKFFAGQKPVYADGEITVYSTTIDKVQQ